jgi:hypothetical protein
MGGSSWSDDTYVARSTFRASAPVAAYTNTAKIDPLLNPLGVKVRESRDSAAHPESNAIAVFFDVTGSMGGIPVLFAKEKLGGLMRMLIAQSTIPDPQILFGAVGDAFSDQAPLQVGQFESGMEMDDCLTKIYLEGNGGGQARESYELPIYWAGKHTSMDCWEKRGKKGYLFIIGDENYYPTVRADQVKEIIGDDIETMTIEAALEKAQETFEVFKICVGTGYPDGHLKEWRKLMGERAIFLDDPSNVCEFIAAQIASCEGVDHAGIATGLTAAGLDPGAIDKVTKALVPGTAGKALKKGTVTGDLAVSAGTSGTERL